MRRKKKKMNKDKGHIDRQVNFKLHIHIYKSQLQAQT